MGAPRADVRPVADLELILPTADVVVLAVPLDPTTRGLVDAKFRKLMKLGALLVNVSRGPVVVTDALADGLQGGALSAALDMTDPEPLPPGHRLWSCPNLLISAHVGGDTSAFAPRAKTLVSVQLTSWATGQPMRNIIPTAHAHELLDSGQTLRCRYDEYEAAQFRSHRWIRASRCPRDASSGRDVR